MLENIVIGLSLLKRFGQRGGRTTYRMKASLEKKKTVLVRF